MEGTKRQLIIQLLSEGWQSLRDLSQATRISEREALDHLRHIERSLKGRGDLLAVEPAECESCGYVFRKRDRLNRPTHCPLCRGTHIRSPRYRLKSAEA